MLLRAISYMTISKISCMDISAISHIWPSPCFPTFSYVITYMSIDTILYRVVSTIAHMIISSMSYMITNMISYIIISGEILYGQWFANTAGLGRAARPNDSQRPPRWFARRAPMVRKHCRDGSHGARQWFAHLAGMVRTARANGSHTLPGRFP